MLRGAGGRVAAAKSESEAADVGSWLYKPWGNTLEGGGTRGDDGRLHGGAEAQKNRKAPSDGERRNPNVADWPDKV